MFQLFLICQSTIFKINIFNYFEKKTYFLFQGTTPCKGDNGGGLVIPHNEKLTTKYYLKAVLSSGEINDAGHCRLDSYVTFTDLQHHVRFIQTVIDQHK